NVIRSPHLVDVDVDLLRRLVSYEHSTASVQSTLQASVPSTLERQFQALYSVSSEHPAAIVRGSECGRRRRIRRNRIDLDAGISREPGDLDRRSRVIGLLDV